MRPHKTELARQTLQTHGGALSMRERRALILCDGRRDAEEIALLLGADAAGVLQRLVDAGYLAEAMPTTAPTTTRAAPAPSTSSTTTNTAAGPRRSLVAARIYLVGMLELQRGEDAAEHRRRLQSSHDDDGTATALMVAMRFLQSRVTESLAQRIRERLSEVLPEEYLPILDDAARTAEPAFP